MKKSNLKSGFLLTEVLVVTAILMSGILIVFQSFHSSIRAMKTSGTYLLASLLLESKIIQMEEELEFDGQDGTKEGQDLDVKFQIEDIHTDNIYIDTKNVTISHNTEGNVPLLNSLVFKGKPKTNEK